MQQAGLFEQQINPTQKIGHRTDKEITPDSEHVPHFDPVSDSLILLLTPVPDSQQPGQQSCIRVSINENVIFPEIHL